jgi:hypothetical protein
MARFLYAIDFVVTDFETAAETFTVLTGIEGVPMWEGYDPTGSIRGIHFQIPGLEALGVMSPTDEPVGPVATDLAGELAAHGDGAFLLCFEAHDLDEVQGRLEANGARFEYETPLEVGDERLNMLTVAGTRITLAHHEPDHWDRWRRGALRGQSTPPAVRTEHRVIGTTVVDIAVEDLDPATVLLDQILGPPQAARVSTGNGEECRGFIYPLTGMEALRVLQPRPDAPPGPIRRHLSGRGPGVARLSFRIADVATAGTRLRAAGIALDEALSTPEAITTASICGMVFTFSSAAAG